MVGNANRFSGTSEIFLIFGCFAIFAGIAMALRLSMTPKKPVEIDESDPIEVKFFKGFLEVDRNFMSAFRYAPRILFCLGALLLIVSLTLYIISNS